MDCCCRRRGFGHGHTVVGVVFMLTLLVVNICNGVNEGVPTVFSVPAIRVRVLATRGLLACGGDQHSVLGED